jgi:hypothetical protein
VGPIAHTRPPEVRPRSGFDLEEFVAEHNANADRIQSLEAKPAITVTMGPSGDSKSGAVAGRLALERPRNFKLELAHSMSNVGDIGSNDERFWFWFQNKKDKSVYYCNYAELSSTSLAVTYQPDWIVEAMGFARISADDSARIQVRSGSQPGTTILAFPPAKAGSQTYSRVLVVNDGTRKVNEFRVLAGDGKSMLARAVIKKYRNLPLPKETLDDRSSASQETCSLPENIILEWKRELLSLDVVLKDVKVNQFDVTKRQARFVQPSIAGYTAVNLAEVARQNDTAGSTAVRETMPAPPSRDRVQLSPPLQTRGGDASATKRPQDPAKSPMLLPVLDLDVVDAPVPSPPGTPVKGGATALLMNPGNSLER